MLFRSGNDWLDGGSDNDTIVGGDQDDTMTGGTGADKFVFHVFTSQGEGAQSWMDSDELSSNDEILDPELIDILRFEVADPSLEEVFVDRVGALFAPEEAGLAATGAPR